MKHAALLLAAVTLAAGCEDVRSCRAQTLLLAFDYSGAAGADQVDVDVTAADGDHAEMIYPVSGAGGTLEVTFKSGYPVGQQVDVVATALKGGVAVAEASASTRPPAGCARVELTFHQLAPDAAMDLADAGNADMPLDAANDLSGPDFSMPDFAGTNLANGASCAAGSQCTSTACVDGRCCGTPSCPVCQTCGGSTPGTCTQKTNGDTQSCTGTTTCDATGACKLKAGQTCITATQCASGNCVNGTCCTVATCGQCATCANAAGTCTPLGAGPHGTCVGIDSCDGLGNCKLSGGQPCPGGASTCALGNCVDGVCCSTASCPTCKACNVSGQAGSCANQPVGAAGNMCGGVNACDGAGTCKLANGQSCGTNGALCATGNCTDSVCCGVASCGTCKTCDGTAPGTCTNQPLGPGTGCNAAGQSCDGSGSCKLALGQPCANPSQCANTKCVDGTCCSTGSCPVCQTCAGVTPGTCNNQPPTLPGNLCPSPQHCDGAGKCRLGCATNADCGGSLNCFNGVCCTQLCNGGNVTMCGGANKQLDEECVNGTTCMNYNIQCTSSCMSGGGMSCTCITDAECSNTVGSFGPDWCWNEGGVMGPHCQPPILHGGQCDDARCVSAGCPQCENGVPCPGGNGTFFCP